MKNFIFLSIFLLSSSLSFSQNEKTLFYTSDTTFLPDGSGVSYSTTINVSGFHFAQTINNVNELLNICINMEHSFLGDIEISITCPNNTTVILENQSGGGTYLGDPIDNDSITPGIGWGYCWNSNPTYGVMGDEAGTGTILINNSLPPGTYTSFEDLAGLIGCPINGDWTITVTDHWTIDNGFIFYWSIDFLHEPNCFTLLTGKVLADINENSIIDTTDIPMSNVQVEVLPGPYYGITDNNGIYKIWVDSGNYSISQVDTNTIWQQNYPTSPLNYNVSVLTNNYDTINNLYFLNFANVYCPNLAVDIVTSEIRICETSYVNVNYINNGSDVATNSYVTVELDNNLYYISGGNLISQTGNLYTFDIGDIGIMESGNFQFLVTYSCDPNLLGTTVCNTAHIYPDSSCVEADTTWDHSSICVSGICDGDSLVCFIIQNTGDFGVGDMQANSEYRIYEDNFLVFTGYFQINGGDSIEICWPANGTTVRLEADQRPGHPGNSHPQESIELCGSPNTSIGQILVIPLDDADDFVEIDCQEVLGSYDPNDKQVVPQGLFAEHYIGASDILEYTIRFQNTGTDTANKVVIIDTISNLLDISSFTMLSSSHNYTIDIFGSNIVRWTFNNILLPDSGANESESHGYIKFKINQNTGNPVGSVINNSASIYFDYNLPIFTNQVFNTIGDIPNITIQETIYQKTNNINIYPNPTTGIIFIDSKDLKQVEINDINGRIVGITNNHSFDLSNQEKGIYFIRITTNRTVVVKKIILR